MPIVGAVMLLASLTVIWARGGVDAMGDAGVWPLLVLSTGFLLLLLGLNMTPATPARSLASGVAENGVDAFLARCRLVAGPVPDPGHPGRMPLALWEPPREYGRIKVLEAFNGTPGPDGRYERLVIGVDRRHRSPLAAAAGSYGATAAEYVDMHTRV